VSGRNRSSHVLRDCDIDEPAPSSRQDETLRGWRRNDRHCGLGQSAGAETPTSENSIAKKCLDSSGATDIHQENARRFHRVTSTDRLCDGNWAGKMSEPEKRRQPIKRIIRQMGDALRRFTKIDARVQSPREKFYICGGQVVCTTGRAQRFAVQAAKAPGPVATSRRCVTRGADARRRGGVVAGRSPCKKMRGLASSARAS